MDIKLVSLKIKNFKGLEKFIFEPNGEDVFVYGDNGTYKTTLYDSFCWLLYDKDSLNSAQFEIKSLDISGEAQHGLEHSVEGILLIDGAELTLKKVYTEKWVKRRGSAHKEFTGHTTEYFVDGVPVKQKEYKDQVNDICDESLSKLLTNPRYFNEILSWQDRRKMILEICGDITDQEVIDSNPDLADLPGILGKHSTDDYKKIVASKRQEINKELDKIPVRIDEIKSSAVETRPLKDIQSDIAEQEELLEGGRQTLKEVEAGGNIAVLTSQIRDIENQIRDIDGKQADEELAEKKKWNVWFNELSKKVSSIRRQVDDLGQQRESLKDRLSEINESINYLDVEMNRLRDEWKAEDKEVFEFDQSSTCPTCGQSLPEEKLKAAREKAESIFNAYKASKLKSISEKGKAKAFLKEEKVKAANDLELKLSKLEPEILKLQIELAEAEKNLQDFEQSKPEKTNENPDREALSKKKADFEFKIVDEKCSIDGAAEPIREEIATIEARISDLKKEELQHQANTRIDARVKELSDQEIKLSSEFEELERHLYLIEQFIRAKVSMLEEKINSRFEMARFKLFAEQINGGLSECCEVTVNGVPYNSINNAGRTQIGLDIIKTLQEHYKTSLSIFIDNREGIVEIPEMESQIISLYVSERDKKLRVESQQSKETKAA